MRTRFPTVLKRSICALALFALLGSCSDRELLPLQVEFSRSVSKLPFIIALDQGLYEKYGLDLEVSLSPPDFEGGIWMPSNNMIAKLWRKFRENTSRRKLWNPPIEIAGANGRIYSVSKNIKAPQLISVAATDCSVRAYIIAQKNIERLDDLKGKRLGINGLGTNTGFVGLLLAEKMGWDSVQDISLMGSADSFDALRDGSVDALVASERLYATAMQEDFSVLLDTSTWGEAMAGNSVNVTRDWLQDEINRETMRRFLMAATEGVVLFHEDRELALKVLEKWHGIKDQTYAETMYHGGRLTPRKPFPCYDGTMRAMQRYDSNEMRKYSPQDFYDDTLMRELDDSGFIDKLYAEHSGK